MSELIFRDSVTGVVCKVHRAHNPNLVIARLGKGYKGWKLSHVPDTAHLTAGEIDIISAKLKEMNEEIDMPESNQPLIFEVKDGGTTLLVYRREAGGQTLLQTHTGTPTLDGWLWDLEGGSHDQLTEEEWDQVWAKITQLEDQREAK